VPPILLTLSLIPARSLCGGLCRCQPSLRFDRSLFPRFPVPSLRF
jgi:hypothetical protein